jgi:hypothetical protein
MKQGNGRQALASRYRGGRDPDAELRRLKGRFRTVSRGTERVAAGARWRQRMGSLAVGIVIALAAFAAFAVLGV